MAQPVEPKSPDAAETALLSRFAARRPPAEADEERLEPAVETAPPEPESSQGEGPPAPVAGIAEDRSERPVDSAQQRSPTQPDCAEPRFGARRVEANEVRRAPETSASWEPAPPTTSMPTRVDAPAPETASGRKVPFWKRITLPRTPQGGAGASIGPGPTPPNLEPVLARLAALEKQLAANQVATESQLTRFEENITRLWELEDDLALTEVRERLALLEANQEEIADGLHAVGRNLVVLSIVLAAAVVGGLAAVGLLL